MKKLLLLFLPLLFVLSTIRGQTIQSTPATPHTLGTPNFVPSTYGSHLAFDKTNGILYQRLSGAWVRAKAVPTDGDKGDITVSSSGTVWSIDAGSGGIYDGDGFLSETPTTVGLYNSSTPTTARELEFQVWDDGAARTVARFGGISGDDDGDRWGLYAWDENAVKTMAIYSDEDSSPTGGILIGDLRATPRGLQYVDNYTATFSARSLPDKAYVDAAITTANATNANLTGPVTSVGNATTITANSIDSTHISNGTISPNDFAQRGASVGQVMTYTANGWRAAAAGGGSTPTLQDVTDAGDETTATLVVGGVNLKNGSSDVNLSGSVDGALDITTPVGGGLFFRIDPAGLTGDQNYLLPDRSGTVRVGENYKVYTALLSQSGTSAPTATVLENTLGGTVVWTRDDVGLYIGTLSGVFAANKTIGFATITTDDISGEILYILRESADAISFNTGTDDFSGQGIEIRVYP